MAQPNVPAPKLELVDEVNVWPAGSSSFIAGLNVCHFGFLETP
jgi:hypothetical protein